jgi:hypothetical protein
MVTLRIHNSLPPVPYDCAYGEFFIERMQNAFLVKKTISTPQAEINSGFRPDSLKHQLQH